RDRVPEDAPMLRRHSRRRLRGLSVLQAPARLSLHKLPHPNAGVPATASGQSFQDNRPFAFLHNTEEMDIWLAHLRVDSEFAYSLRTGNEFDLATFYFQSWN